MQKITQNHGPLCAARETGTDYKSEGDNSSWYHEISVGLRQLDNPDWGGWGGRYKREAGTADLWTDASDADGEKPQFRPQYRWTNAFQNDYLARADWCVKEYAAANHAPIVKLSHPENLGAKPGDNVTLSAVGTTDPDNNTLTYNWWQYKDASTFKGTATIANPTSQTASLTMPAGMPDKSTIHIICEVTDNGTPPLTRYRRVVIINGEAPVVSVSDTRHSRAPAKALYQGVPKTAQYGIPAAARGR